MDSDDIPDAHASRPEPSVRIISVATTTPVPSKGGWWKYVLLALLLVLYPICFFGGCVFGVFKSLAIPGPVVLTDGLRATYFVEVGNSVSLSLVTASNESPNSIVVDFRDADSGTMINSETVTVEQNPRGFLYFEFKLPREFFGGSSRPVTATIRSR